MGTCHMDDTQQCVAFCESWQKNINQGEYCQKLFLYLRNNL